MANPGYINSVDGSDADNGSTWALANATAAGAMADQSAGDRVWVSDNHAESTGSAQTITMPGTLASPMQLLCGDDAAEPPTALATTGSIATTGASLLAINGVGYVYGLTFDAGSGASAANLTVAGADGNYIRMKNCNLRLINTSATSQMVFGTNTGSAEAAVVLENVGVRFAAAGQTMSPRHCRFRWQGGSLLSGGTSPTNLLTPQIDQMDILIEGVDLSNASAGINIFTSNAQAAGKAVLRNCKLPASWSGDLGTPTAFNTRFEMHNCDAGDTNYRLLIKDYAGTIQTETTIVRTGGASDGTTSTSLKMTMSANAEYPLIGLESPDMVKWNDTTGSAITVTVEIVHDSVGSGTSSRLTDAEIGLRVQYLGTSGFPLASFIEDFKSSVIASAADQTDSSETWTTTGLTTPLKQKLSVTFTPQEKGYIIANVVGFGASDVVYVDNKLVVT